MFFFLKHPSSATTQVSVTHLGDAELPAHPVPGTLYLRKGVQRLITLDLPGGKLLLLGDPVFGKNISLFKSIVPATGTFNEQAIYERIKGHFYWFCIHSDGLSCGTSFGAIFPMYYSQGDRHISISSSSFFLAEILGVPERSRRNLLERLLFNYPFFGSTWWEGIHLLDAHRYLNPGSGAATVAGDFDLHVCFGQVEMSGRDSLLYLASVFREETNLFFPGEPFAISMTGGFDGRTLVAAALEAGKDFFTYSFGRPGNSDVTFPMTQAKKLQLTYYPLYLGENYLMRESLPAARSFMELTGFNGNFGRPHYEFAARKLAEKTRCILTGNFGSELFRALHLPGVMMSESLIRIFGSGDDSWKDFLKKTTTAWGKVFFKNELDALISDLEVYLQKMQDWEPNHRFYYFVFNEILRKYFGPELVMQSRYLRNRTPFLNLRFLTELNRTPWSGVHSRLFEKNKGKRMKGQMFYAAYLRQTSPELYLMPTNKGYSPADVLEPWRWPWLAAQIAYRKFLKSEEIDDHSVEAFFRKYHRQLKEEILEGNPHQFFREQLDRSLPAIAAGSDFEKWIRFYSIAAGWEAALQPETAIANP
jgi:asparagine synthase (glutamine-hydrolysing)